MIRKMYEYLFSRERMLVGIRDIHAAHIVKRCYDVAMRRLLGLVIVLTPHILIHSLL